MLGGGAAFYAKWLTIACTSEELEKQVALPLLEWPQSWPRTKSRSSTAFRQAASHGTLDDSSIHWPPSWESLDLIYKNIQLLNSVSSSNPWWSLQLWLVRVTLALGLALSAARLHQRVLLIDADLRRPNLHKLVNSLMSGLNFIDNWC